MRKQVFGRQLKRDTNERKALFKGLLSSLVLHDRILTTEQKAKAIRAQADKMVTIAKKRSNPKDALQEFLNPQALTKLLTDVAPRFTGRQGGYTRIIKTSNRFKDNASQVYMEWTERSSGLDKKIATTETQKKSETQKLSASKKISGSVVARKSSTTKSMRKPRAKKGATK